MDPWPSAIAFVCALQLAAGCGASSTAPSRANEAKVVVVAAAPVASTEDAGTPSAEPTEPVDALADKGEGSIPDVTALTTARQVDSGQPASLGQSLGDGRYVFPDGLRIEYRYKKECDFDVSVPCIWSHEIKAFSSQSEEHLSLTRRKPKAVALGHSFEITNDRLIVRK